MSKAHPAVEEPAPPSLRSRIRRMQEETGSVDPRELAAKMLTELDPSEVLEVLAEVLPEYVRQVMISGRKTASQAPPASSKVASVRAWYERLMSQPVDVSGSGTKWKALADCTRDELLTLAYLRRENAARSIATAERYERLAKVMPADSTVGDLPSDMVTNVFGRAAE